MNTRTMTLDLFCHSKTKTSIPFSVTAESIIITATMLLSTPYCCIFTCCSFCWDHHWCTFTSVPPISSLRDHLLYHHSLSYESYIEIKNHDPITIIRLYIRTYHGDHSLSSIYIPSISHHMLRLSWTLIPFQIWLGECRDSIWNHPDLLYHNSYAESVALLLETLTNAGHYAETATGIPSGSTSSTVCRDVVMLGENAEVTRGSSKFLSKIEYSLL